MLVRELAGFYQLFAREMLDCKRYSFDCLFARSDTAPARQVWQPFNNSKTAIIHLKINVSKIFNIVEQTYKAELNTSRYRSIVVISSRLYQLENHIVHQAPFAAVNAGHKAKSELAVN